MHFPLFKNRMFLLLTGGQGISILGDRLYSIALMWYIIDRTGSPLSLGLSVICMTLPSIVIMPWAGVLADGHHKKKILLLTDVCSGVLMFVLMTLTLNDRVSMLAINLCLVLVSAMKAFFSPALSSSIPLVVTSEQLSKANASFELIRQISNIAGPALGGMLIAFIPISALFAINGISFMTAAVFSAFLSIPSTEEPNRPEGYFRRFTEGLHYTFRLRRLLMLILVGGVIINFFLAPLNIYFSFICNQVLHVGPKGLGWIETSISIGALLGSAIMASGRFKNQILLAVVGLSIEGTALIIGGLSFTYASMIILAGMLGFGICLASVGIGTSMQQIVDKSKLGRVMSFTSMLNTCTVPLGILTGSILMTHLPPQALLATSGFIVLLSGLSLLRPFKEHIFRSKTAVPPAASDHG
ncbi:MFS transporter [Paenibacillus sp. SAFN-054]|uniref:MFS transporter n=2 Tax=unclassified Paenibacillus TaxID=185978 RepID=UPI003F7F34E8